MTQDDTNRIVSADIQRLKFSGTSSGTSVTSELLLLFPYHLCYHKALKRSKTNLLLNFLLSS